MFARFSFLRLFKCPLTTSRKSRMDWNIPQTKSHHKGRPFENLENNTERYGEGLQTYEHNSFSCLASFKNGYAYAMISQHTLKISTFFFYLLSSQSLLLLFFSSNNHALAQRLALLFCVLWLGGSGMSTRVSIEVQYPANVFSQVNFF